MAEYNPMTDPNRSGQGYGTSGKDIWSPTQNRWIAPDEVKQFLSSNPNQQQILSTASNLGLTSQDLNTALKGQGYSGQELGQKYGTLTNNLWTGGLGYSAQDTGGHNAFDGKIVAGGGHYESTPGVNGGSWINGAPSNITFGDNGAIAGGGNLGMGSGGGYGGNSGGGMQSQTQGGGQNPYLADMGKNMVSQMQENYTRNQAPLARSGAMAAGGFGGSRQGIAEANGLKDLNRGISQGLTSLYGTDWTNAQNRNLQQQSINNSYDLGSRGLNNQYDLGLRSSDLGFANLDANIANSNFSNQLNAANFGLNATNAMNGKTGAAIQAGTNVQRTPMDYHNYFTNAANNAGGLGGNTTGSQTSGSNPYASMAGGAMMGYDLYKRWNQPQQNLGMGNSDRTALYGNMGYTGQP